MVAPDDIPRALSEEGDGTCGLTVWPDFLADCDTPLSSNAVDIRGLWSNGAHMHKIEQCGDRITLSGPGTNNRFYVHDFPHADGTFENGCADYFPNAFPACSAQPGRCLPGGIRGVFDTSTKCMTMFVAPNAAAMANPSSQIVGANRCLVTATDGVEELHFTNSLFNLNLVLRRVPPPPPPPLPPSPPAAATGLIVGLAAGGGGLLMIVLLGVLLFMRRKKKVAESAVPKKLGIAARLGWGRCVSL